MVSCQGVTQSDRSFLDYNAHFHPEDGDCVMEMKEEGKVVGYTYFLNHVRTLAMATFIVDAISCITFRGLAVNAHIAYVDPEKLCSKPSKRGKGRGRGRGSSEEFECIN